MKKITSLLLAFMMILAMGALTVSAETELGTYVVSVDDPDPNELYLNVRASYPNSPDGGYDTIYGQIWNGTEVEVTEIVDGWGKFDYEGKDGWIRLSYTTFVPGEPTTEETTSEETTSEETTSEDITSEDITSEDITSEDITSEDITSEDITSEDITSEETTSENESTKDAVSESESSEDEDSSLGTIILVVIIVVVVVAVIVIISVTKKSKDGSKIE